MKKRKLLLPSFLIVFVVLVIVLTLAFRPVFTQLQDSEYRRAFAEWIQGQGALGVLLLFAIEIIQIILPFIPGGPVQVLAGAAYGKWFGALILLAGCAMASTVIYLIMGRYALPLALKFFGEKQVEKYRYLINARDEAGREKRKSSISLIIFIAFLIPGLPKDLLTYLAPASGFSAPGFILLSLLARFPALFASTVIGAGLANGAWLEALIVFAVVALLGILGIYFHGPLLKRLQKLR